MGKDPPREWTWPRTSNSQRANQRRFPARQATRRAVQTVNAPKVNRVVRAGAVHQSGTGMAANLQYRVPRVVTAGATSPVVGRVVGVGFRRVAAEMIGGQKANGGIASHVVMVMGHVRVGSVLRMVGVRIGALSVRESRATAHPNRAVMVATRLVATRLVATGMIGNPIEGRAVKVMDHVARVDSGVGMIGNPIGVSAVRVNSSLVRRVIAAGVIVVMGRLGHARKGTGLVARVGSSLVHRAIIAGVIVVMGIAHVVKGVSLPVVVGMTGGQTGALGVRLIGVTAPLSRAGLEMGRAVTLGSSLVVTATASTAPRAEMTTGVPSHVRHAIAPAGNSVAVMRLRRQSKPR